MSSDLQLAVLRLELTQKVHLSTIAQLINSLAESEHKRLLVEQEFAKFKFSQPIPAPSK